MRPAALRSASHWSGRNRHAAGPAATCSQAAGPAVRRRHDLQPGPGHAWHPAGHQRGRRLTARRADHPARSDHQRSLFAERAGSHARHHRPAGRVL